MVLRSLWDADRPMHSFPAKRTTCSGSGQKQVPLAQRMVLVQAVERTPWSLLAASAAVLAPRDVPAATPTTFGAHGPVLLGVGCLVALQCVVALLAVTVVRRTSRGPWLPACGCWVSAPPLHRLHRQRTKAMWVKWAVFSGYGHWRGSSQEAPFLPKYLGVEVELKLIHSPILAPDAQGTGFCQGLGLHQASAQEGMTQSLLISSPAAKCAAASLKAAVPEV